MPNENEAAIFRRKSTYTKVMHSSSVSATKLNNKCLPDTISPNHRESTPEDGDGVRTEAVPLVWSARLPLPKIASGTGAERATGP